MTPEAFVENTDLPLVQYVMNSDGSETLLLSCAELGRENKS